MVYDLPAIDCGGQTHVGSAALAGKAARPQPAGILTEAAEHGGWSMPLNELVLLVG